MEALSMLSLQAELLLLMLVGVFARRKGIVTKEGLSSLSSLCINIIFPCNIFKSFLIELDWDILQQGGMLLLAAILMQVFYVIVNKFLYCRYPVSEQKVLQYCTFVPNGGFIGNAVAEGLYGTTGLLYASLFLIPQRALIWSVGTSYFTEQNNNKKEFLRAILTHPCLVAVYLGLIAMLTQVSLPTVLTATIGFLGNCNTALIMIVVGATVAEFSPRTMVTPQTIYYCILRLAVFPVAAYGIGLLCGLSGTVMQINILMAGTPAGTTSVILAQKYGGNAELSAKCVLMSTILSMVTMPVLILVIT